MNKDKVRWGIISTANIAVKKVIPAIINSVTGEAAAIASRNLDKAKKLADQLGIAKAYGSYDELLADPDIDAVYIPLPNHMHKEWTIRAAEAGKHVLCEKPLALNEREAVEMVEACDRAGIKMTEAFMYRYHPRYERIKAIIQTGEIGDIRGIHAAFTFNNPGDTGNVRFNKEMGGGAIYDVGAYPISAARFILGSEPEAATTHAFFSPDHDNVDMMASGLLEFTDNVGVTFDCGMWAEFRNTLQIVGSKGKIDVPHAFVCEPDNAGFSVTINGETREEEVPEVEQYTLEIDSIGNSILSDLPLRFEPNDAIDNMRVIDACLRSAKERIRVSLT
jgi:xylose dehydrogenase (NAD/NADP)